MPKTVSVQNKFTRGLITEAHGLDFPEDACIATENCVFTLIGEVSRRLGIDIEPNGSLNPALPTVENKAVSTFRWINAGGDGSTELLVTQVGNGLGFYKSSQASASQPISQQFISGFLFSSFLSPGQTGDPSLVECQYATGNGYLFVFHPYCDPIYCTYNNGVIVPNVITLQ